MKKSIRRRRRFTADDKAAAAKEPSDLQVSSNQTFARRGGISWLALKAAEVGDALPTPDTTPGFNPGLGDP